MPSVRPPSAPPSSAPLRWGVVGTGAIAGWMAAVIRSTPAAILAGVASRRMECARQYADTHGAERAFDDWGELLRWDGVDAVYIATPTGPREGIAVAAAEAGRHVLAEKPFASLPSLRRITNACRAHGVCFMDATHFVHHPRHAVVVERLGRTPGPPRSLETRFLVDLGDRGDIRYDPELEPLGALGDLGWYNLRATVEYLTPRAPLASMQATLRRDAATGAIIEAAGTLAFEDGEQSRWRCAFTAQDVDIGLRLTGSGTTLSMENFVGEDEDHSASFGWALGEDGPGTEKTVRIASRRSGPALMFEDFAAAVVKPHLRAQWVQASERTQGLLDAVREAAEG